MVDLGSGAKREVGDIALTRYACYLIAQNGDPSKDAVAFAQTYFAVQTRKQEIIERRLIEVERLSVRKKLTTSEKALSGIIFERLGDNQSFARIRSKGDQALFGGMNTQERKINSKYLRIVLWPISYPQSRSKRKTLQTKSPTSTSRKKIFMRNRALLQNM